MKNKIALIVLLLWSFAVLADEQDNSMQTANPLGFLADIFSPKPSTLAKLIESKKFKEADQYLSSEKQYFLDNKQDQMPLLKKLAVEMNAIYEPQLGAAEEKVSNVRDYSQDRWKEISEIIGSTNSVIAEYRNFEIFKEETFHSNKLRSLESAVANLRLELAKNALTAFEKFNHFSDSHFFAAYPGDLNGSTFLEENADTFRTFINTFSVNQLIQLKRKYAEHIDDSGKFNGLLSSRYFSASIAMEKPPYSIGKILGALRKAREAGFNPRALADVKIAFVEVTSKTLLKEGQIEFPAQIEMDLPFEPVKAELDEILDDTGKPNSDYIIIFDVAAGKVARRIIAKNDLESKYVSGSKSEANPAYEIARGKLFESQSGLANANGQYAQGLAGAIIKGVAVGLWQKRVTESEDALRKTPSTVSSNLFETYKYSTSCVFR